MKLAKGLDIPAVALATQVVAALGMRGSGKSNLMGVIAEGLLDEGIQCIFLDSVGIWFSLRLKADGKTPSRFKIPVLGGNHGDIPLEPTAGAVVATALARSHGSAVLDISRFSKGNRSRFLADFGETFMQAKMDNKGPCTLFCEEAQRVAPQKILNATPYLLRMLGAFEEMAETGRNYGIGEFLASLRPQKINKDVLNLAGIVFAFQANGVLERKAVADWVQEYGAEGRADVHGQLPGLPQGTALVWAPSLKIYGKFAFPKKSTYDAGATPTGEIPSVNVVPIDLGALAVAMAATIEESKANDPTALRRELFRLRAELASKPAPVPAPRAETKTVPAISEADFKRIEKLAAAMLVAQESFLIEVNRRADRLFQADQAIVTEVGNLVTAARQAAAERAPAPPSHAPKSVVAWHAPVHLGPAAGRSAQNGHNAAKSDDNGPPGGGMKRMLGALASTRKASLTKGELAGLSDVKKSGGTFGTYISLMRGRGWIEGGEGDAPITITDAGRAVAGEGDQPTGGRALLDFWVPRLTPKAARMLEILFSAEQPMARNDLAIAAELDAAGGTFGTYLSHLTSRGLVQKVGKGIFSVTEIFNE
jgi:hypothetical protein